MVELKAHSIEDILNTDFGDTYWGSVLRFINNTWETWDIDNLKEEVLAKPQTYNLFGIESYVGFIIFYKRDFLYKSILIYKPVGDKVFSLEFKEDSELEDNASAFEGCPGVKSDKGYLPEVIRTFFLGEELQ